MQMNYLITSLQENEKFKEVVENVNEKISPIAISGLHIMRFKQKN